LWERIGSVAPRALFNPYATVLELEPLALNELVLLGEHIRDLHAVAYAWEPQLPGEAFETIASNVFGADLLGPPRWFVRRVVSVLDLLSADSEIDFSTVLSDGRATAHGDG
jgi:hypothetical protein